ncbi:unnamed protein product [Calicophoron daubneyi]|uniref:Gag protein n=1 Tax=Calicophoron daubneyi TaxID=300641 RepID=A0AAV2TEC4_CALDB
MAMLPDTQNGCASSDGEEKRSSKRLRSGESVIRGMKNQSGRNEPVIGTNQSDTIDQLARAFSILASTSNYWRAPIPMPPKFNMGDNYRHWEDQVRRYLKHFAHDQHGDLILDLLIGEAYDRVNDAHILQRPVAEETFREIRNRLDPPGLTIKHQRVFY